MPEVAGRAASTTADSAQNVLDLIERYLDASVLEAKERQIREEYTATSWDEAFLNFEAALFASNHKTT